MADEPIRELILTDCETSLLRIKGTGVYWNALAGVRRGKPTPGRSEDLLVAVIDEGDETITEDTSRLLTRVLPVGIDVAFRLSEEDRSAGITLSTLANRMLGDVERTMTADPTRGKLAKKTTLLGNSITLDEAPGVLGAVHLDFEMQYFTLHGNPASKG